MDISTFIRRLKVAFLWSLSMVILSLLWLVYFACHSVLASLAVKTWVKRHAGSLVRYYRFAYNIFSIVTFVAIFVYERSIADFTIVSLPRWTNVVGGMLMLSGGIIVMVAVRNYNVREFIGLEPMDEFNRTNRKLVVTGLNSWVRHPLYSATFLLLFGYLVLSFTVNTLIFCIIASVYLFIGSVLEERKLLLYYGKPYADYLKRVNRFLPW